MSDLTAKLEAINAAIDELHMSLYKTAAEIHAALNTPAQAQANAGGQ